MVAATLGAFSAASGATGPSCDWAIQQLRRLRSPAARAAGPPQPHQQPSNPSHALSAGTASSCGDFSHLRTPTALEGAALSRSSSRSGQTSGMSVHWASCLEEERLLRHTPAHHSASPVAPCLKATQQRVYPDAEELDALLARSRAAAQQQVAQQLAQQAAATGQLQAVHTKRERALVGQKRSRLSTFQ